MNFVDFDSIRIAYRKDGVGEAIVLIHGITTYSFVWKEMIPRLSGEYETYALDLLGCGESSKPEGEDYSIAAQAKIVLRFMDTLGIDRAHVAGHDIGGGIAQIMAVGNPERFLSLTLINTVGYDYWPVQPIVTMRVPILRHIIVATLDMGVLRLLVERGFHHCEKVDEELMELFRRPLRAEEGRKGFLALAKSLDNSQLMAIAGRLPGLPMPVLVVRGDRDIYLKESISERLHREIGGSRFERIATAGHFAPLDEPDLVAGMMLDFIGKATSRIPSS